MPEGAHPYPRWEGPMRTGPAFGLIAGQEIRRTMYGLWFQAIAALVAAYTIVTLTSLFQSNSGGTSSLHTVKTFVDFLNNLRFGALALTAVIAGPSLLEDVRKGGLELYFSRAVRPWEYLVGKIIAVLGVATVSMVVPALLYWLTAAFLFKTHPADWGMALGGAIVYGLMWALFLAGVGLGLSAASRSTLSAALILLVGVLLLEIFFMIFAEQITRQKLFQILSPLTALRAQTDWLFDVKSNAGFDPLWGLLALGAATIIGWGLVAWKHPRVKGAEA